MSYPVHTEAQIDAIAEAVQGTCDSLEAVCERLEIPIGDVNELESALVDVNTERCTGCGWWSESCELSGLGDTDLGEGLCQDCKDDQFG